MIRWLLSLFGIGKKGREVPPRRPAPGPRDPRAVARPPRAEEPAVAELSAETKDFLVQIVSDAEPTDLQALPLDDRVYLAGILKRIRENKLNIPLLPQAALEISRLMANPNSHLDDFVRVLESDPALSVDVLRIANSAFYGFSDSSNSVHQAVVRIGLSQIRGLIIVAHLHGRVLQGGTFQAEAAQLSRLSMTLAQLGQELASSFGLPREAAFTRGVLSHVEHFVIMGTAAEVSADHQRKIIPTTQGLHEAFRRFGPRVRELTASAWGLSELVLGDGGLPQAAGIYGQLARSVVAAWTGAELPLSLEGVDSERLSAAMRRIGLPALASAST